DGLNIVLPHAEEAYYAARPTIAIGKPGSEDGGHPLDEHFALHPALAALMPLWQAKQLAFVHAAGSPDPTRSHFDAQQFLESGTPGRLDTTEGWMNRLLGALPGPQSPTSAVADGPTLPHILRGRLAGLIARNRNIRLAFLSLGGWDTHIRQGNQKGQLADRLRPLGDGLAAFAAGLGHDWDDMVVVVLSEFGRTVKENGDGGTDHGH